MKDFLSSPSFHFIGIPIIFVLIGVFANRLGRRDGDKSPKRNDFSVGTTTILTALGAIASDLPVNKEEYFSTFVG